jgi:hypothetical protein
LSFLSETAVNAVKKPRFPRYYQCRKLAAGFMVFTNPACLIGGIGAVTKNGTSGRSRRSPVSRFTSELNSPRQLDWRGFFFGAVGVKQKLPTPGAEPDADRDLLG